jgi:hypothetical protein
MHTGDGLDRVQPADKNSKVRVAVLTNVVKPKMAWVHFIQKGDKKTVYRCLIKRDRKHVPIGELADCCKKLNNDENQRAQIVFAVLAVKYVGTDPASGRFAAAPEGQAPQPPRWELGWLKLSRSGFKTISELVPEVEKAIFEEAKKYADGTTLITAWARLSPLWT